MPEFECYVYVTDEEGEDVEIAVTVEYNATYRPARISGPPENCYPDESEMELRDIKPTYDLPRNITNEMVVEAAEKDSERLEEEAWEDFMLLGEGEE